MVRGAATGRQRGWLLEGSEELGICFEHMFLDLLVLKVRALF